MPVPQTRQYPAGSCILDEFLACFSIFFLICTGTIMCPLSCDQGTRGVWRSLEAAPLELRVEHELGLQSDRSVGGSWLPMGKCAEFPKSQLRRVNCTGKTPMLAQQTPGCFWRTVIQSGQHSAPCLHLREPADRYSQSPWFMEPHFL